MQGVPRLASVSDAAPREMALVVDLEAELRHARVLTMGQLETYQEKKKKRLLLCLHLKTLAKEHLTATGENRISVV